VKGARRPAVVAATIKNTELYHQFQTLTLSENMRVDSVELDFLQWPNAVGNGLNYVEEGSELIAIPEDMLLNSVEEMINHVFPQFYLDSPFESKSPLILGCNKIFIPL